MKRDWTAKKSRLQPKEYKNYVITERWHKREPKTPLELAAEKFGRSGRETFPEKDAWRN